LFDDGALTMNTQRGYSLIELVVVILIIGILLAGLAIPLSSQVRTARVQQAQTELERIKDALIGYAIADPNRRLPCPDQDGDGQGDNDGSAPDPCDNPSFVEGDLPWADLGIGRSDPWGNPYRYRADNAYTAVTGVPDPPDTSGAISVVDLGGNTLTVADPKGPAAVVFSTGPNQSADDDNGNGDNVFAQDLTTESFDDILVILSKNVFINRLVQSQKWPP
jgi:prepilin-type N-terminal cleavage/methylation domain-containing protein